AYLDSRRVVLQHLLDAVGHALRQPWLGMPRSEFARPLRRQRRGRAQAAELRRLRERGTASYSRGSFSTDNLGVRPRRLDRARCRGGRETIRTRPARSVGAGSRAAAGGEASPAEIPAATVPAPPVPARQTRLPQGLARLRR